jgi:hypothetical protein
VLAISHFGCLESKSRKECPFGMRLEYMRGWENVPEDMDKKFKEPNHPEGTGIVAILLIFYWNGILFEDKDILADGLGIGVCFWDGGISGLLCTEETDIIV